MVMVSELVCWIYFVFRSSRSRGEDSKRKQKGSKKPSSGEMRGKQKSPMFILEFPNGGRLKLAKLDWPNLQVLKDQVTRDILKIESMAGDSQSEYFLDEKRTRGGVFGMMERPPPFLDANGNAPTPGIYKVILKDNAEDLVEHALCGSLIEWTTSENSQQKCREFLGDKLQYYQESCPEAEVRYSIAGVSDRLIITLDYSNHSERMLGVLKPINIIDMNSPNSSGAISGQVYAMAQILPFSMLLDIVSTYSSLSTVLFTGLGFSGSVAHVAAIIFRDYLKQSPLPPLVKCVSFSGPLCGSPTLHHYLTTSGQLENHATINCNGVIFDRLLADYQRLSPLASLDLSSWNSIFDCFHRALASSLDKRHVSVDIGQLMQSETNLNRHPKLTHEGNLLPIGRYVFRNVNGGTTMSLSDIYPHLCTLQRFHSVEYTSYYSLLDPSAKEGLGPSTFPIDPTLFQPTITEVSVITTQRRLTINFVGKHLDTILNRLRDNEIPITPDTIDLLPTKIRTGRLELSATSRVLSIRAFPTRAVIDMTGVTLHGNGSICLRTDFGDTNELTFTQEMIVKAEDPTPSKSLHPTMNAEFLSAAYLRCVICKSEFGVNQDPSVTELWKRLLDLENDIFDMPTKQLSSSYDQYLRGDVDIGIVRNSCLPVFEEMSRQTTSSIQYQDHVALRGLRKITGALLRFGAGLITFTGVLLSVPVAILAIPMISVFRGASRSERPRIGIASGAYLGVMGLVGLPSVIMVTLGMFLSSAGVYAMSDYPTHQYKEILQIMIEVMGGNSLEVVDEVPQLEDCILLRAKVVLPELVLSDCSIADIQRSLRRAAVEKGDPIALAIQKKFTQQPLLYKKLQTIGRICAIRQLLQHTLMIGFVGVHNAGKSTTISGLFQVTTGADLIVRTEKPVPYHVGGWVDQEAKSRPGFADWLNEKGRNTLRLYAVDFPGTTDEREAVATMTYYTAELASMFVVILKAGHVAGPEKEVVDVVKGKHKPFLVVINHCDTIAHELKKPGNLDRIRQHYADILKVDPFQIHFMCALDPSSNDNLRGILFGQMQTLIGNSEIVRALAMRMIPPDVAIQLPENMLELPQQLASAAYSLLFNLSSVTKQSLEATFKLLIRDTVDAKEKPTAIVDFKTLTFAAKDIVRQTALALDLPAPLYCLCLKLIDKRSIHFKDAFNEVEKLELLEGDTRKHLDQLISTLALSSLRDQLLSCFGKSKLGTTNNLIHLVLEFLVLACELYKSSLAAGYVEDAVVMTMTEFLTDMDPFDQNTFFVKLMDTNKVLDVVTGGANELSLKVNPTVAEEGEKKGEEIEFNFAEINQYRCGQSHLEHMRQVITFQISEIIPSCYEYDDTQDIKNCKEKIMKYVEENLTETIAVELPSMSHVLPSLIKIFSAIPETVLKSKSLRFRIKDDEAIDANGVTRSVFTKAAQELNDDPAQVYFLMDEDSKLLYPDPNVCMAGIFSEDSQDKSISKVMETYRALGRLIGYTLSKTNVGVTFPAHFPLVIYKILLGLRIGISDLAGITPSAARTLEMYCLLSDEDLHDSSAYFSIGLTNHEEYELCPNGKEKPVSSVNRLEYLSAVTRFYLCCGTAEEGSSPRPLRELILGIQHAIPRDIFSFLSPLALQILIEGEREIDLDQWQQFTVIRVPKFVESAHVVEWFWNVVRGMSNMDRQRLLVFSIGSATLPSNGFQDLAPPFTLHVDASLDPECLPEAHTCFSMLVIPRYSSEKKLEEKLLLAISETNATTLGKV